MHSTLLQNEMKREKKCALLLIKTLNSKLLLKRRELWSMYCTYFLPSFLPSPKVIAIDSENVPHFSVQFFFSRKKKKHNIYASWTCDVKSSSVVSNFSCSCLYFCCCILHWSLSKHELQQESGVLLLFMCVEQFTSKSWTKKNGLKNLK